MWPETFTIRSKLVKKPALAVLLPYRQGWDELVTGRRCGWSVADKISEFMQVMLHNFKPASPSAKYFKGAKTGRIWKLFIWFKNQ